MDRHGVKQRGAFNLRLYRCFPLRCPGPIIFDDRLNEWVGALQDRLILITIERHQPTGNRCLCCDY